MAQRNFRVNRQIRIPEIRLIDETGEQVGIVATDAARRRAEEAGLDLVEVSPTARPPVCRILDYGKFKYDQRKKERSGTKHVTSQLKELRVRPMIDKHDLEYRLKKGREFLAAGHKVQVVCVFRGRQMDHPEHGHRVMREVADYLSDLSKIEANPRLQGRRMTMLLTATGQPAPVQASKPAAKPKKSAAKPAPKPAPVEDPKPAESAPAEEAAPQPAVEAVAEPAPKAEAAE